MPTKKELYAEVDRRINELILKVIENPKKYNFLTLELPDDIGGTLKVKAERLRLELLRKQIKSADIFNGKPKRFLLPRNGESLRSTPATVLRNFMQDGEVENARQYKKLVS